MKPTPETDRFLARLFNPDIHKDYEDVVAFARKLEQERDKARNRLNQTRGGKKKLITVMREIQRQRDAAVAKLQPVPLAANDAALITQPDYIDVWRAYVTGARSGQKHPNADDFWLNRAADGFCKLLHAEVDPEHFAAMGNHGLDSQNAIVLAPAGEKTPTKPQDD